ncbi:MAG: hypothetical protein MJK18_05625 [Bdellovibrionales bacterium]|nr:hypothetical protein [Bdellovibrionales bacterium]
MRIVAIIVSILFSSIVHGNQCIYTNSDSVERLECDGMELTQEFYGINISYARLTLKDGFQLFLDIEEPSQELLAFNVNQARALTHLRPEEVKTIAQMKLWKEKFLSPTDLNALAFFKNIPALENLKDIVRASQTTQKKISRGFLSICSSIGKRKMGFYDVDGNETIFSKSEIVGDKETRCYGRCGPGCNDDSPTYTQECLNHDICHRETGENFGVCSDEWWSAAHGYLLAPLCWI